MLSPFRHTRRRTPVIANTTRGAVLAHQARPADNPWTRFVGLMGQARLPEGGALVLTGTQGVHTHFMRFPIDLVFYDRDGVVVDVVHRLRPWRFSPYRRRAHGVIELPAGVAQATGTQPGDVLSFLTTETSKHRGAGM
ncbi:MAG: DUF192 domain-containing protein [Chloroflexi bacterium]|nr:DUF192 domain-containing protein [Chloroflexota bacterium]